jgi:hypothetical protein
LIDTAGKPGDDANLSALIYIGKPLLLQENVQDAKGQFVAKLSHKVFDG